MEWTHHDQFDLIKVESEFQTISLSLNCNTKLKIWRMFIYLRNLSLSSKRKIMFEKSTSNKILFDVAEFYYKEINWIFVKNSQNESTSNFFTWPLLR